MRFQASWRPLPVATIVVGMLFMSLGATGSQAQAPIVQPGPPGEPSRLISAEAASDLAGIRFTDADVKFMQGMISHHAQAIEMTELLALRSERDVMRRLAQRIELSQEDEITMMQEWLRSREQAVTALEAHHAPGWEPMPGMLTDEEMGRLEAAPAGDFDPLFLEFMIKHHRGAVTMVETLLSQRGAAQDSQLFAFTADITSDPFEIAFFDRGPINADRLVMGGYWSAYWYRGFIYGTEMARGLDVLELLPSEYLTQNELAAASAVAPDTFNSQQQRRIEWSARPVVARAYLDQLVRSDTLTAERRVALSDLLDRVDQGLADGSGTGAAIAAQLDRSRPDLGGLRRSLASSHTEGSRGLVARFAETPRGNV